nr:hypothetical protein Iba_chr01aCG4030 [Ipomoea batatas]
MSVSKKMAIDHRCSPRSGACMTVEHLLCSYHTDLFTGRLVFQSVELVPVRRRANWFKFAGMRTGSSSPADWFPEPVRRTGSSSPADWFRVRRRTGFERCGGFRRRNQARKKGLVEACCLKEALVRGGLGVALVRGGLGVSLVRGGLEESSGWLWWEVASARGGLGVALEGGGGGGLAVLDDVEKRQEVERGVEVAPFLLGVEDEGSKGFEGLGDRGVVAFLRRELVAPVGGAAEHRENGTHLCV